MKAGPSGSASAMDGAWPPRVPNASWPAIVSLQLRPWQRSGIDVDELLRQTRGLRDAPAPSIGPPTAALIDTHGFSVQRLGARWVGHHTTRLSAVLNLFRLAQRRAHAAGRPLPRTRFLVVVNDGHGTVAPGFNASCTCKTEATCCDPKIDVERGAQPAAPAFATLHCRHSWDVSVPTIIDDLLSTRDANSIRASLGRWLRLGEATPWERRQNKAFFVGDGKAYRPAVLRVGRASPQLFDVHEAVSNRASGPKAALPFARHAQYKALVYAHGFHFNSVRWRRYALLGGAVVAAESPCKEWWQMAALPWVHYAPAHQTFSDLEAVVRTLLHPAQEGKARRMAAEAKALAQRAFSYEGLLDYIEELWRQYAALSRKAAARSTPPAAAAATTAAAAQRVQRPAARKAATPRPTRGAPPLGVARPPGWSKAWVADWWKARGG